MDGHEVAAGNDKLMKKLGLKYYECHTAGTIIHMAIDKKYAGHIVISDVVKEHSKEAVAELSCIGFQHRAKKQCGILTQRIRDGKIIFESLTFQNAEPVI